MTTTASGKPLLPEIGAGQPAGVGLGLTTLLDAVVRPEPDAPVLPTIVRVQLGAQLLGALLLAAAAPDLTDGQVAVAWRILQRPRSGSWNQLIRLVLPVLRRVGHPLGAWSTLLRPLPGRRQIDRWLSDYESSLRHHGRLPPSRSLAELVLRLRTEVGRLCDDLGALVPPVRICGNGGETFATCAGQTWRLAPYVKRDGPRFLVWSGELGKLGAHWLCMTEAVNGWHASCVVEERSADWQRYSVAALLLPRRGEDPLFAYLGLGASLSRPVFPPLAIAAVTAVDVVGAAEALAAEWRDNVRPVIVIEVDGLTDPATALCNQVGLTADAPGRWLEQWATSRAAEVVVVFAGANMSSEQVLAAENEFCLSAVPGDAPMIKVVICTPAWHVSRAWPMSLRRRIAVLDVPRGGDDPEPVAVRRAMGNAAESAWRDGGREVLRLFDPPDLIHLEGLFGGRVDIAAHDGPWHAWSAGALTVRPDGSIGCTSPALQAFVAGLLGTEPDDAYREAWMGGVLARADLRVVADDS